MERVTIPRGGLGTKLGWVRAFEIAELPSHTVGSEPFKVRLFVEAAKRSSSHTVGLELELRKQGLTQEEVASPSHPVGLEH